MARKKVMTVQLPPTTCTPEMRAQVVEVADRRGVSIADVVRDAITLFLHKDDGFFDQSVEEIDKEPA
jgi:hypothetical protein